MKDSAMNAWEWVLQQPTRALISVKDLTESFAITRLEAKQVLVHCLSCGKVRTVFRNDCTAPWRPHLLALASLDCECPTVQVAFERV